MREAAIEIVLEAAEKNDVVKEVMLEYGKQCQRGKSRGKAAYKAGIELGLKDEITRIGRERHNKRARKKFMKLCRDLQGNDMGEILNEFSAQDVDKDYG